MQRDNGKVLLRGGNVLHIETGIFETNDILIDDNRIITIAQDIQVEEDFQVVECAGKWLIPGLIDMHCHIKMGFAPLFTAAGVTTVRNMAGSLVELDSMIQAPDDAPTPRVISTDRLIDGPPGLWGATSPYNLNTADELEAREEVRRQVAAGAEFLKVYGLLDKHVMQAVVEEAKLHGKGVSCDLIHSSKVNAVEAAELGVKWNEHASGFVQAMYPESTMSAEQPIWDRIPWDYPDEEKIVDVCKKMIEHDVVLCPTMVIFDQANLLKDYWHIAHPVIEKAFENEGLIQQWNMFLQHPTALQPLGRQHKMNKAIAYTYHKLGGKVVAGTDTPAGIFSFPGMGLHRELELFVDSGFTELEAIKAATIRAAEALELTELGSIRVGHIADLVVLHDNPLELITNTRNIKLVVKGGVVYTPDTLLEAVPSNEEAEKFYEELEALLFS